MLITKTKPVGIDFYIQKLQTQLHDKLLTIWGLNTAVYKSYGRAYRNKTDAGYVAEVYTGAKEYKEVYWDDSISAISFFGIGSNIKNGVEELADVHMVFFVNIAKLKPAIVHRADEEVRRDVTNLFGVSIWQFSFLSVDLSIENVLREYPGSYKDPALQVVDRHPTHCFRLNFKLIYDSNKIC
jgi:hypothetical protein